MEQTAKMHVGNVGKEHATAIMALVTKAVRIGGLAGNAAHI